MALCSDRYSMQFGPADLARVAELCRVAYPDYGVSFNKGGYWATADSLDSLDDRRCLLIINKQHWDKQSARADRPISMVIIAANMSYLRGPSGYWANIHLSPIVASCFCATSWTSVVGGVFSDAVDKRCFCVSFFHFFHCFCRWVWVRARWRTRTPSRKSRKCRNIFKGRVVYFFPKFSTMENTDKTWKIRQAFVNGS